MYIVSVTDGEDANVAKLEWTTESPTKEGMYKTVDKQGRLEWSEVSEFILRLVVHKGDEVDELSEYVWWLGPLPEPERPKG